MDDADEKYWENSHDSYISHAKRLGRDRLVVSAVVCAEDKVLLVRRAANDTYPGMWEFPGGGVDESENETTVEACRRETKEETGIDLPQFPTGEVLVHPTRTALRIVLRFDLEEIPNLLLSHEHDEALFLNLDEAKLTEIDNVIIHDTMRQENQGVMHLLFGNSMGS